MKRAIYTNATGLIKNVFICVKKKTVIKPNSFSKKVTSLRVTRQSHRSDDEALSL